MIDPIALSSITAAVTVLGNEFLKGVGSEAGKTTWTQIKGLLKWKSDPKIEDIPKSVATALTQSPDLAEKILELLKKHETGSPTAMVGNIHAKGGKWIIAETIKGNIQM
jgi:hypothetical protein